MKLTLSATQVAAFANRVPRTGTNPTDFAGYPADLSSVFTIFRNEHDPFTRKDVEAVMVAIFRRGRGRGRVDPCKGRAGRWAARAGARARSGLGRNRDRLSKGIDPVQGRACGWLATHGRSVLTRVHGPLEVAEGVHAPQVRALRKTTAKSFVHLQSLQRTLQHLPR